MTLYVTGEVTPDVTGAYEESGTYLGLPAYTDGSYWIFSRFGDGWGWDIAETKGGTAIFLLNGVGPTGDYTQDGNTVGVAAHVSTYIPEPGVVANSRRPPAGFPSAQRLALSAAGSVTIQLYQGQRLAILHVISAATTGGKVTLTIGGVTVPVNGTGNKADSYYTVTGALPQVVTLTLTAEDGEHAVYLREV